MSEIVYNNTTTLGDMVDQVYFLISEKEGSSVITRPEVIRALNAALTKINQKVQHNAIDISATIGINDMRVNVPDAIMVQGRILIDAVYIDGESLTAVKRDITTDEVGTPTSYFVDGNEIVLVPAPDAEYTMTVRYRAEHAPLADDDDTIVLSDICIDAITLYAAYMMKLKDEEYQAADRFKAEWEYAFREATSLQPGVYKGTSQYTYGGAI